MKHPEWAIKHKIKGTELLLINGTNYQYLIEAGSSYMREHNALGD